MINIFSYNEYRIFLKDFISHKKQNNNKYSYSYYSKLIGTSESYIKQVISERRNLSLDKSKTLSKKIKLSSTESSYFMTLVMLESAKTNDLKQYFSHVLINLRKLKPIHYDEINKYKTIFHNSLTWELYTLLGIPHESLNPEYLQSILSGNYSLGNIEKALNKLESTGCVKKESDNRYITKDIVLKDDVDINSIYINFLKRCIEYLVTIKNNKSKKYFDSFCIILNNNDYPKIEKILEDAKRKIIDISRKSKEKNTIAYFNSNFFFASKTKLNL